MNKTLVISIDALITADIQRLKELPNLGVIMKNASWVEDIFCFLSDFDVSVPCYDSHRMLARSAWNYQ